MYKDLIDQKDALFLIDYNELTGDCFWKARSLDYVVANKVRTKEQELKRINDLIAGTKIGSYSQDAIFNGLRIRILGRTYKLSRVIWLYMTGECAMTDRTILGIALVIATAACAIYGASGAAFFFGIILLIEFS